MNLKQNLIEQVDEFLMEEEEEEVPFELERLINDLDYLITGAKSQESWRNWYQRNSSVVDKIFGDDSKLFKKILGATSQGSTVASNVALALKAYDQIKNEKSIEGYLAGVKKNLNRIKDGEWPTGQKINPYTRALSGEEGAVAVDRHIAELLYGKKSPSKKDVREASLVLQHIAEKLGWQAREVQAALWAFNQVEKGADSTSVESYDAILERKEEQIKALIESLQTLGESRSRSALKAVKRNLVKILKAQLAAIKKARRLLKEIKKVRKK